jgi:RimJ/RimL family protein N-acetyltransferase
MTPTLEGPRLRLEPLTLAHLPGLEKVAFAPAIWRYMPINVESPTDLSTWAETALRLEAVGTGMPWVIVLKVPREDHPDEIIGSTRFIDLNLQHKTVEIGHTWLHPAYHGTGLNTEVKLLQIDYAFNNLGLNRVTLKTHHQNLQSQAAIRKLGATYEGTFRNHMIMPDGSQRHTVWFSILREEWSELRPRLVARLPIAF